MAYMNQERKRLLAPEIKKVLAKYKLTGSIGVDHHSTLVVRIKSGPIDFIGNFNSVCKDLISGMTPMVGSISVNTYHINTQYTGKSLNCLRELIDAMNIGNHNRSDYSTDYHDVGWYIDIDIGNFNQHYILEENQVDNGDC
jgi:hypothetical protein